jgi:hypothetical protein
MDKGVNQKTAEAVSQIGKYNYLLSKESIRVPSNKIVATNLSSSGLGTKVSPSLTKIISPAGASKSILYSDPSQVKNLYGINFVKLSPSDLSIIQRINDINRPAFSNALEEATGLIPDVRVKEADSLIGKIERYKIAGKNPRE